MNEENNIYNKKMNEVFDVLESHSFVVEPDTRVVEMSIAQDAVEDALNFAEKSKIKIKPLEFNGEYAYTSVAEYEVYRDDEDHRIHACIDGRLEGVFDYLEKAKQHCEEHYEYIIKQCLITEEKCNAKPALHPMTDIAKDIIIKGYNDDKPFIPLVKISGILNFDGYLGIYTSYSIYGKEIHFSIWGEWIADLDYSFNILRSEAKHSTSISFKMSMQIIDLLNQWGFDYRGLINKGLAVDINTI